MATDPVSDQGTAGRAEPVAPSAGDAGGVRIRPARRHRQVLRQFRILLAAVREQFHRVDPGAGLGTVQAWALSIIEAQPGIGVARLASALDVRQPTASNVVKSLCGRGLIERRRGESDRRTVQLFVLDEGRSLLPRARSVFSGPLASALSNLDTKTLLELGEDLRKVLARMPSGSAAKRHRRSTEPDGAA